MKFFSKIKNNLPSLRSSLLALASAVLLILAFPGFEFWFIAWFALIPLLMAIDSEKESFIKSFITGWIFGTIFFFGSTWWLTFAPITYAKVPASVAYFLLFCATSVAGLFPALFSGVLSLCLKRFGHWAILAVPFIWTATEFLRLWTTGNNWNAIGYSQAFNFYLIQFASIGGVFLVSFFIVGFNTVCVWFVRFWQIEFNADFSNLKPNKFFQVLKSKKWKSDKPDEHQESLILMVFAIVPIVFFLLLGLMSFNLNIDLVKKPFNNSKDLIIAVQPNVPMSGLTETKWRILRQRQIDLAENATRELRSKGEVAISKDQRITVILPESPMNFQYQEDQEFRDFINGFARANNVSVLFNSAEPDRNKKNGYFNSAVLVSEQGKMVTQYDKIYLLPFGEKVPLPESIEWIVPTMVGRFTSGIEYDLLPFGEAKAGVMICFESHFPSLAREYVRNGADVLVEMTNDGYLGNTPVLRQHLASAVFRAVETNRPVLRVTNVGVTAYVNERGEVLDEAPVYQEATRVWSVSKSDGEQTIYVKYGEWFAWLCSIVSLGLLVMCFWRRDKKIRVAKGS
jgi:apolipoprotein N-acyltransferase